MDTLVRLNRQLRNEILALSLNFYDREFCTITCNIGRHSGKSEWIRQTATKDDLIVTVTQDMAKLSFPKSKTSALVLTARTLRKARTHVPFLRIFVDEPDFVFKDINLDEFYNLLAHDPNQTFFFLGGSYSSNHRVGR